MPLGGPTIFELKESFGAEEARLIEETAQARMRAIHHEVTIDDNIGSDLSTAEIRGIRAAQGARLNLDEYDSLRAAYLAKHAEFVAAIAIREEQILDYLAAKNAGPEALAAYMLMGEEQIIQAADIAAQSQMVDTLKLLLSVSRVRDFDLAENHIAETMEADGWVDLLVELNEAAKVKEFDEADDRWESFSSEPLDKKAILSAQQSDSNIYGMMRQ